MRMGSITSILGLAIIVSLSSGAAGAGSEQNSQPQDGAPSGGLAAIDGLYEKYYSPDTPEPQQAAREDDERLGIQYTQADEAGGGALFADADEAARQTSNPLGGDFMVLINEWNIDFYDGDLPGADDQWSVTHVFQPVVPFSMAETIGPNWILVNRPTLPIIYHADIPSGANFNPAFPPGEEGFAGSVGYSSEAGIADISHFSLLGTSVPSEIALLGKGDRVLAGGFSMNIPIGDSTFTNDAWAIGPAAVAAFIGEKGIVGVLAQTQFDFAGDERHNVAFVQPFYYVNLGEGWQLGGAPLWLFDFETNEHQIPIGLGVQKTQLFQLGDDAMLPVRFGLEGRYHVDQNDLFGPEYSIVASISPILPNIFSNWLRGCPTMSVGGC